MAIINLYENQFEEVNSLNIVIVMIFFIAIMILAIASYLVENITLSIFDREFKAFKTLILRVDPVYFVSNPELIELFYNRKNEKMISSSSHAAFYASHDAMISVNIDLVIENVNPAVTDVFGFTPEQDLNFLISYQINKRLYSVFDLMKSGETSLVFECDANGNTDDSKGVPLHLSVIGFKNESGLVTTFAVLMKDMTEEEKQRLAVEEAKKQAELILLQILPKDIIIRLNRGDKNIDFTVKSSTIIFIDIEKFSEYSATLSTKDIMLNLSKIFTVFDKICSTFNLITKIKLIGDDYMAAAGLFTPEIIPVRHALQMIQFALQCLEALEELNVLLNSSLQVRIGINTDGPLIAGVLGTDKPMFDIIGDPINVAARLQSTCIPGLVQISESTYNLVANMDFNIEERGEIELKGKGKRKTFLIHPEIKRDSRSSIFMLDDDVSSSVLKQLYDQQAQKSSTIKNKK
ncbi:adenylate cyclase, type VII [Tritrichomonas foetus]|uniref:Adenylate cyclase, type VII n=1 Tax=Tritrichomonas foetus TaxID=1144522 RepID=A0A1J4K9W4_9EUKA|nr:adenylate cyclase, type VII [Tritrichomonas foetus]|eukprot:OHT08223.1 adenylate cyclase, type VII [Tritrichomonas foetus]